MVDLFIAAQHHNTMNTYTCTWCWKWHWQ